MKYTLTIFCFSILFSSAILAQSWTVIPYEEISDDGLRIISLYEDTDGNIWGGNGYSGRVIRWDGTTWETYNSSVTGMNDNAPYVGKMLQDSAGKMWFCSGDGVATWENGTWFNYKTSNSDIPQNSASGILEEDGKLWFSMRKSLVSFDGTSWTDTPIPDANYNSGGLASMGNGSFFVSMVNGDPTRRFDGTNWEIFSKDNSDINSDYQYHVARVDDQTFWFGGPSGRANIYENGTWTPSGDIPGWSLGLSEYITGIAVNGSKDDVWFSTGDGLFHLKDGIGTEYKTDNSPMTTNEVHTVMIASNGDIWCATENEILIFGAEIINSTTELTSHISLNILANPVKETVNLTVENKGKALGQNGVITIYNTNGQAVITQKMTALQMNIEVMNLTKGIYILEYVDQENRMTTQFVKQ